MSSQFEKFKQEMEGPLDVPGWAGVYVHEPEIDPTRMAYLIRFDGTRVKDGMMLSGGIQVSDLAMMTRSEKLQDLIYELRWEIKMHLLARTHCKCRNWNDDDHTKRKYHIPCEKHLGEC